VEDLKEMIVKQKADFKRVKNEVEERDAKITQLTNLSQQHVINAKNSRISELNEEVIKLIKQIAERDQTIFSLQHEKIIASFDDTHARESFHKRTHADCEECDELNAHVRKLIKEKVTMEDNYSNEISRLKKELKAWKKG
jgi:hypothetical protein